MPRKDGILALWSLGKQLVVICVLNAVVALMMLYSHGRPKADPAHNRGYLTPCSAPQDGGNRGRHTYQYPSSHHAVALRLPVIQQYITIQYNTFFPGCVSASYIIYILHQ